MKKRTKNPTLYTTRGAIIAVLYVVLTLVCSMLGLSSGPIQLRLSEALCVLPLFFPEAIPGLFIGCVISNLLSGAVIWDVVFGSVATLIGALGARLLMKLPEKLKWVATLPTVAANALIIPAVLMLAYGIEDSYFFLLLTVGIGEILSATVMGAALYYLMAKKFKKL